MFIVVASHVFNSSNNVLMLCELYQAVYKKLHSARLEFDLLHICMTCNECEWLLTFRTEYYNTLSEIISFLKILINICI